jgi:protein SCO1/2
MVYTKLLVVIISLFIFQSTANAISDEKLSGTEIYEKLNSKIDLNLEFTDQNGKTLSMKEMFKDKDVLVFSLNYFRCTTMCTFQFVNLAETLKDLNISHDDRFQVAAISFDPSDAISRAKTSYDIWTAKAGDKSTAWNFYVGQEKNIASLAKSLNFYYEKDDEGNYSHAGALFFIKPDGTFYRYLYGIVYDQDDFKHALIDTSNGNIGSVFEKILVKFKKYDSVRGKYISWI